MTLCDTGTLVALIVRNDPHHARCVAALSTMPDEPLRTTWPCLAEAMYLLGRAGGPPAQEELRGFLADGDVALVLQDRDDGEQMRALMRQYRDAPMDLADASLVAAAEALGTRRVFTLDRHFHAYRIAGREPFEVVP